MNSYSATENTKASRTVLDGDAWTLLCVTTGNRYLTARAKKLFAIELSFLGLDTKKPVTSAQLAELQELSDDHGIEELVIPFMGIGTTIRY